jgi:UDP-N-acetylmuramyl pentapeptide phosphotransferase/UDP-N-acetylglucosamine-1-phosphate transferase
MGNAALVVAVVVATGLTAYFAVWTLIPILRSRGLVDHPNERSSHTVPTPRGGGIAVIGSVSLGWLILAKAGLVAPGIANILLGAGLLAAASWIDDLRGLSPLWRLLTQGVAVAVGVTALADTENLFGGWLAPACSLSAVGLLWVWWINLFNFMDGIDGLAGGEAAAIAGGLLLFATFGVGSDPELALLAAAVIGAAVGFLLWNWSPARIFLGDVGSAPLGYLLGFLLLDLAIRGFWKSALILPLYFLADATITLARRLVRGERVWQAHREHYYQRAVRCGLGHAAVVRRVIAANILLIGCAWTSENGWATVSLAASVVIVVVLLVRLSHGLRGLRQVWADRYMRSR